MKFNLIALFIGFSSLFASTTWSQNDLASKVVVVANKNVPESIDIAKYYIKKRGIPSANLVLLDTSDQEVIDRTEFNQTIANPLLKVLMKEGFINAIADVVDYSGQLKPVLFRKNIEYIVLCFGIPVHVQELKDLNDLEIRDNFFRNQNNAQFSSGPLAKNEASVDGEISILLLPEPPRNGFIPNPYHNQSKAVKSDILKVTRLDGPSPKAVKRMIQQSLEGEKKGLRGRAYVDEDGRMGGFAVGNKWMAETATIFESLGFSLTHDKNQTTINNLNRIDTPVLYAGWYAGNLNAPFDLPGFSFPPGSIATHLHSFSARPLRSENRGWVGPFVNRGVSATIGNTAEPYLALTHNLSILFSALSQGRNFADAAYAALPGLSWQGVAIGDPLFRPFAVNLEEQYAATGDPAELFLDQYVVIRKMNLAPLSEKTHIGQRGYFIAPGPALALELGQVYANENNNSAAIKTLKLIQFHEPQGSQDWVLFSQLGDLLNKLEEPKMAFNTYEKVLKESTVPELLRKDILEKIIPLGIVLNSFELTKTYQTELNKILEKERIANEKREAKKAETEVAPKEG